jgi:hypothetical protein
MKNKGIFRYVGFLFDISQEIYYKCVREGTNENEFKE